MARRAGSKNELVKCPYCGEMYSVTYKSCPFCNGDGTGRWDEPEEDCEPDAPAKGGKRLVSGGGSVSGGRKPPSVRRIISTVVSLALMIAAAGIVISIVRSFLGGKKQLDAQSTPSAAVSAAPSASAPAASADPEDSADPAVPSAEPSAPSTVSQSPAPQATTPSADLIAPTDFKLNREDFTLDHVGETFQMAATYTPANARGDITWKSSDPNVASVSWNGVVTAVSKGTVTVTATVAGVGEKTCIVRCNFKDTTTTTTSTAASAAPSASGLKLSREDFTLAFAGDSWRLVVSGASSAVTWSSSNSAVATVSSDGTVTAVSRGTCTVSATVDGVTLKCIVRCSF